MHLTNWRASTHRQAASWEAGNELRAALARDWPASELQPTSWELESCIWDWPAERAGLASWD